MRIIGIDPGTRALGWGLVEQTGTRRVHVAHGVVKPSPNGTLSDRLLDIDDALRDVIAEHQPDAAAVESIFFAKGAQSAAKLGHARGVVLLGLRRAGLPVHEFAPAQIKRAVVGRGRADKHQVAMLVAATLGLDRAPPSDAADALAVALTCLAAQGFEQALARRRRG